MKTPAIDLDRTYTPEEYGRLPDLDCPSELVRGKVICLPFSTPRHGQVCSHLAIEIGLYSDEHRLGHVVCNNAATITERRPDTVRGPDVSFYSFERMPPGRLPDGYLPVLPDLIFEVRMDSDRWSDILAKVAEYLSASVTVVCVVDVPSETVIVIRDEGPQQTLRNHDELHLPDILGNFRVSVHRFFE